MPDISELYQFLMRTLRGSISYEFDGSVLTLTQYFTGKHIKLDLGNLTEEMLEELLVPEEEKEYDE